MSNTNKPTPTQTHSKTPWFYGAPNDVSVGGPLEIYSGERGQTVAQATTIENAEHICRVVNSHAALVEALDEMQALVERAQDVIRGYLPPDSGVTEHEAMNRVIYVLDCPEQHAAQQKALAALAQAKAVKAQNSGSSGEGK